MESLASLLLRTTGHEDSVDDATVAAIEERLREMLQRARAQWPDVHLSDEELVRHLADRLVAEASSELLAALRAIHPEDLYLACACATDDPRAIAAFEQQYLPAAGDAASRIDRSPEFVAEVKQQTRCRLLLAEGTGPKRISTYRGTGRLRSWVQVAATRTALELRRRARPEEAHDDETLAHCAEWNDDPELGHVRVLYREEFVAAFKGALAGLNNRQRNILRMYLLDGLNIDQIGGVYRVHRATVARWIARAREDLLDKTRQSMVDKLRISDGEFQSLMGAVRSHIDLSLERFLYSQDE